MTDTFNPAWHPLVNPQGDGNFRVREAQFGDGYAQEAADGLNVHLQDWSLTWIGREGDPIDPIAIRDWLVDHIGVRFKWTPPAGVEGTYVCKGPYGLVPMGVGVYQLTAKFTQRSLP